MSIYLAYMVVGVFAGVLAGMMGIGGGIIFVPALFFLFKSQGVHAEVLMHLAVGSSLTMVIFTAISTTRAHHRRGAVLWPVFRQLLPGIAIGALCGAVVARYLPTDTLRILFGCFEMLVAVQIAWGFKPKPARTLPSSTGLHYSGAAIGSLSAILGIGGGTIIVPYLLWCNVSIQKAVATSSAVGLPLAIAGATGFAISGWHHQHLPEYSTGYLYWPAILTVILTSTACAPIGAWLAHNLPVVTLKRCFAGVLFIVALRMVW